MLAPQRVWRRSDKGNAEQSVRGNEWKINWNSCELPHVFIYIFFLKHSLQMLNVFILKHDVRELTSNGFWFFFFSRARGLTCKRPRSARPTRWAWRFWLAIVSWTIWKQVTWSDCIPSSKTAAKNTCSWQRSHSERGDTCPWIHLPHGCHCTERCEEIECCVVVPAESSIEYPSQKSTQKMIV